jgi:hypothetical protein
MMKYLPVISFFIFLFSCDLKEDTTNVEEYREMKPVTACGTENAQKNIPWLAELIEKAETDETGNYWGSIWLEKYKGHDIFVVHMMLGSGGIMYYFFDCEGKPFAEENDDFTNFMIHMELKTTVYSNIYKVISSK